MRRKLSICIPAYNRPQWLKRALKSIISQDILEEIEIIVTDDSSDEECHQVTNEVLENWLGQWMYEFNQPRLGMTENWNHSLKLASGEYVLVLHDDDFLLVNSLKVILETIEQYQNKYAVFLFGVNVVDEQEQVLKQQTFKQPQYLSPKQALIRLLSNSSFVRFPAIVFQRQVLEEVGYFNPVWAEPTDLDMWIRLFSRYGVMCLPDVTCAYTVHSQALTMGVFNEKTIRTLLDIFAQVDVLSKDELEQCKATFFHQFILAGAFRKLRRGQLQEFTQVMQLFELSELQGLKCPSKWLLLRWVFEVLAKLSFSLF
ncbi:glycosyl transferase [Aphanothece hegewaldii CCALA 016]|uniref:Glycosyl transferase n=1 Tax=Aphanothece hegewaldii CCALA 016 TaxID=2107694 RepID=A0A2T1LX57_9CHRO|nr:glycosyltransferase family 2 protein [Aphanothece hegewaldii]PSF36755.1 glycosyl transferase [Aphanothece hegewaldii CCALA 016]